jgi:hypothetical protein
MQLVEVRCHFKVLQSFDKIDLQKLSNPTNIVDIFHKTPAFKKVAFIKTAYVCLFTNGIFMKLRR